MSSNQQDNRTAEQRAAAERQIAEFIRRKAERDAKTPNPLQNPPLRSPQRPAPGRAHHDPR